ncbi:MAG: hypothetical protein ACRYFX_10015 [Janthinobacterium lividum]
MINKDDLDATIEHLKEPSWSYLDAEQKDQFQHDFKESLKLFILANYVDKGYSHDTIMCSIHDAFPSHHSCVACNLQPGTQAIERFLLRYDSFTDVRFDYSQFIMLLYLLVENVNTYLDLINMPQAYRARHFQVFQEVKYWANFLKHPKSFMLVLHPSWTYKGLRQGWQNGGKIIIDSAFTREYYSGDKKNPKLYEVLARRSDVAVSFPNPVELTKQFMRALQKFVAVINENEMAREMLESETMVKRHFSAENEDAEAEDSADNFL